MDTPRDNATAAWQQASSSGEAQSSQLQLLPYQVQNQHQSEEGNMNTADQQQQPGNQQSAQQTSETAIAMELARVIVQMNQGDNQGSAGNLPTLGQQAPGPIAPPPPPPVAPTVAAVAGGGGETGGEGTGGDLPFWSNQPEVNCLAVLLVLQKLEEVQNELNQQTSQFVQMSAVLSNIQQSVGGGAAATSVPQMPVAPNNTSVMELILPLCRQDPSSMLGALVAGLLFTCKKQQEQQRMVENLQGQIDNLQRQQLGGRIPLMNQQTGGNLPDPQAFTLPLPQLSPSSLQSLLQAVFQSPPQPQQQPPTPQQQPQPAQRESLFQFLAQQHPAPLPTPLAPLQEPRNLQLFRNAVQEQIQYEQGQEAVDLQPHVASTGINGNTGGTENDRIGLELLRRLATVLRQAAEENMSVEPNASYAPVRDNSDIPRVVNVPQRDPSRKHRNRKRRKRRRRRRRHIDKDDLDYDHLSSSVGTSSMEYEDYEDDLRAEGAAAAKRPRIHHVVPNNMEAEAVGIMAALPFAAAAPGVAAEPVLPLGDAQARIDNGGEDDNHRAVMPPPRQDVEMVSSLSDAAELESTGSSGVSSMTKRSTISTKATTGNLKCP
ncbi:expressed unknown protein [Seminavis robusta]|uniref:Uncharacterized protein n=1 Tax=Seminavis robusta TaxID=568900 RepID=A0A9N8E715_9STRA|nr:expressed unknown protein [Seminavis robusta]|eukprot:Sro732_g194480.1 n/a (602) ;mRNA; r:43680-45683